jgi:hypothetical protein
VSAVLQWHTVLPQSHTASWQFYIIDRNGLNAAYLLQSTVMLESVNYWIKSLNSMACSKVCRNTETIITHPESHIHVLAVMFQTWEAIHNLLVPLQHLQDESILHYWILKTVNSFKNKNIVKLTFMLDIFHNLILVKKKTVLEPEDRDCNHLMLWYPSSFILGQP